MRISDWSSDVCSSDLGGRGGGARSPGKRRPGALPWPRFHRPPRRTVAGGPPPEFKKGLMSNTQPRAASPQKYKRVLLKISGEALMGNRESGMDPALVAPIARAVAEVRTPGHDRSEESRVGKGRARTGKIRGDPEP